MKRDVSQVLLIKILLMGLSVVSSIITARFLEPDGRGYYYLLITLASLLAQFSNLGLQSSNIYYVARNNNLLTELYSNSVWVSIVAGSTIAATALGVIYFFDFFERGDGSSVVWALALVPLMLFYLYAANLLVGMQRFQSYNRIEVLNKLLAIGGMLVAGILSGGVSLFIFSIFFSTGLCIALLHVLYFKNFKISKFKYSGFKTRLSYGLKAYIATFLGFVVLKINIFFTGIYLQADQLGQLSIASQIGDMLIILPSSIALVLLPKLVAGERLSLPLIAITIFCFFFVVWLFLLFFGEDLIVLMYGIEYKNSALLLLWFVPAVTFVGLISIVSQYIASITIPWVLNWIWLAAVILILPLTYFLIIAWGVIGAINALTVVYALVLVALCVVYRGMRSGKHQKNQPLG